MKQKGFLRAVVSLIGVLVIFGCGEEPSDATGPAEYLVTAVDSIGLQRMADTRTFVGDSLYEYIDGGAELYHAYDFIQVATADYVVGGKELVVDIYEFATPDNAFGLYSTLRPDGAPDVGIGAASFDSPSNLIAVKGVYVLMVTSYEDSDETRQGISRAADFFGTSIPGTMDLPETFSFFPDAGVIEATDKVYAESFLGRSFLSGVYSRAYSFDTDTVVLFLTPDQSGQKYLSWTQQLQPGDTAGLGLPTLPYDAGYALQLQDSYYGGIVAGLKSGWLAGVVGYKTNQEQAIADWLSSLAPSVGNQ